MGAWVCGEALIDLLPAGPVPGGGPANTSIALARLGVDVHFIGGLSTDAYGTLLRNHLADSQVGLDHVWSSELPTALAIVSIDSDGSAQYEFRLDETATFSIARAALPTGAPTVLHIGSLATIVEPAASALHEWAGSLGAPIVFDPNVRPAVISDVDAYRTAVQRFAAISSLIKLSDDDLNFLFPHLSEKEALRELMHPSVHAIVLTRGVQGLSAVTRNTSVVVPGLSVEVVDTVGAGDTVGAVLVEALVRNPVHDLDGPALEYVLQRAVRASAITCSRAGCQPPTLAELGEYP